MQTQINDILRGEYISLDVESTGLNVRRDKVIGIGIASSEGSVYLPLLVWNGSELVSTNYNPLPLLQELKKKKLILHNAAYDLRIIKHDLGIDLLSALYCDTILLKHTVEEIPPFGLKDIAVKYAKELGFDRDPTLELKELKDSIHKNGGKSTKEQYELYKADVDIIGKYCEQDCLLALSVFHFFSKKLIDENLVDFYYKDEVLPLYREVSIPMMERGIKLDLPKIKRAKIDIEVDLKLLEIEVQSKLKNYSSDFKAWFFEKEYPVSRAGKFASTLAELNDLELPLTKTGKLSLAKAAILALPDSDVKSFFLGESDLSPTTIEEVQWKMHGDLKGEYFININSKDHLKRIIFNYLGEKPDRYTEKGAYQLNDEFLQSIQHKYDFIEPLLVYNKLSKLSATYMDRFLDEQENGIFYPQFNQHRTISGRFGSDIQQLPRLKEDGHPMVLKYNNMIRSFFISRPFHIFVDSDYESLEPHIFASVSGDKGLQDIFNNGLDFYSTIAIMTENLEGVSADKKADNYLGKINKAARQKAKAYSLGIPYSMSDFKLAKELDITQTEAQRLINQYLGAFPELNNWMNRTDEAVKTKGFVTTLVGRKRRMFEAVEIYKEFGEMIFDSLELWKRYHDYPSVYENMKDIRRKIKNYIGNGRNFQIQSLAASVVNRACILINREFKLKNLDAMLLLQCHDELLVECKSELVEIVKEIVQRNMENVIELPVTLKAPPSIGRDYGAAK